MNKIVCLLLLSGSAIYAQLNFYEGYVISENGDTLRGEIKANPKKELSLYAKVMFKDKQGFTKTYKADKIKGFAYFNPGKNQWNRFVSIVESEPKFYKISIQKPVQIYEYQYEDMKVGGDFYTAKEYYIKDGKDFVKLKSKKLKKQLSAYIDNEEVLSELEKMDEIDIEKLYSLLEKHYSKSTS